VQRRSWLSALLLSNPPRPYTSGKAGCLQTRRQAVTTVCSNNRHGIVETRSQASRRGREGFAVVTAQCLVQAKAPPSRDPMKRKRTGDKTMEHFRRGAVLAAVSLALFAACSNGMANDSAASLAAGGIVLETTDRVAMASEDLRISADAVAVDYEFESVSGTPETLMVAFPLPEIDTETLAMDGWPLIADESINFLNFSLEIDGRSVVPAVQQRAIGPDGADRTKLVMAAGLPISPFGTDLYPQVEALVGTPQLDTLSSVGLVQVWDDWAVPTWKVETIYHWEMTVPATGTLAVAHRYAPAAGGFFHYPRAEWRQELDSWCVGDHEHAGIERLAGEDPAIVRTVDYILQTASNWAGPIGHFRLAIDKGSPDAIVSLCFDGELNQVEETLFVFEAEDYRPTQDLSIAFFSSVRQ
jgi:hypothetical protein